MTLLDLLTQIGDVIFSQDLRIGLFFRGIAYIFVAPRFKQTKTQKQHSLLTVKKNTQFTLWQINIDHENHQFLVETNLPTFGRVYVNLLEHNPSIIHYILYIPSPAALYYYYPSLLLEVIPIMIIYYPL